MGSRTYVEQSVQAVRWQWWRRRLVAKEVPEARFDLARAGSRFRENCHYARTLTPVTGNARRFQMRLLHV